MPLRAPRRVCFMAAAMAEAGVSTARGIAFTALFSTAPGEAPRWYAFIGSAISFSAPLRTATWGGSEGG
eukprot:547757-Pyramimonas_sp.AAC.1